MAPGVFASAGISWLTCASNPVRGHAGNLATTYSSIGPSSKSLGLVVKFDAPDLPEDCIHRVGRTARAEAMTACPRLRFHRKNGVENRPTDGG